MARLEEPRPTTPPHQSQAPAQTDGDFQGHAAKVGQELAQTVQVALASLPGFLLRPKWLATALGQTVATTSRLMKAIRHTDPLAVVLHVPGPDPLRRLLIAAREKGADAAAVAAALVAVAGLDGLIQRAGGDRSTLNAILTTWLPDSRREFVLRRRQAIFKSLSELKGVSTAIELDTKILHPSADGTHIDLALVRGSFNIERIRPDVPIKFETRPLLTDAKARHATNLAGEPVTEGLDPVRLDTFCNAPPAPLVSEVFGDSMLYTLGGDGFGVGSSFDLLFGELNLDAIPVGAVSAPECDVFFFNVVDHPTRKLVFDLFVHRDLFPGREPGLLVHDASSTGPLRPNDPQYDVDRIEAIERVEPLGSGTASVRIAEIANYVQLIQHAYEQLGWDPDEFRGYRVQVDFPLIASQISLVLTP